MCARHTQIPRIETMGREARAASLALYVASLALFVASLALFVVRESESAHAREREHERERARERESARERQSKRGREREKVCACVCESESMCVLRHTEIPRIDLVGQEARAASLASFARVPEASSSWAVSWTCATFLSAAT